MLNISRRHLETRRQRLDISLQTPGFQKTEAVYLPLDTWIPGDRGWMLPGDTWSQGDIGWMSPCRHLESRRKRLDVILQTPGVQETEAGCLPADTWSQGDRGWMSPCT